MKKLTKEEALAKIEELKKYVADEEQKATGVKILNRFDGSEMYVSTKTTIKEAVLEALESGANLSRANLYGADLSEANLSEANLSRANLYGADLSEANLSEANLSRANLRGANLREANLSRANLYGADLSEANLSEANLSRANLRGANLREANLDGANLCGAELDSAKFYGKGGTVKLKKNQVADFLNALGFQVED